MILRQNENLIKTVRRHWMFLVPAFATWLLVIAGFIVARYWFNFDFFGYWRWTIIFVFLLAILVLAYKFFLWRHNALIITDQRVVENEQWGFFSQTVTELLYQDILEVSYTKKGMNASMYNYGDVKIKTAAAGDMIVPEVAQPEAVVEAINQIRLQGRSPGV